MLIGGSLPLHRCSAYDRTFYTIHIGNLKGLSGFDECSICMCHLQESHAINKRPQAGQDLLINTPQSLRARSC
jgi:hypothetical protein